MDDGWEIPVFLASIWETHIYTIHGVFWAISSGNLRVFYKENGMFVDDLLEKWVGLPLEC